MKKILVFWFVFSPVHLFSEVLCGIDVVKKNNFDIFRDKKVALIVNHTSLDREGKHTVDLFIEAGIELQAIFSPEHGFFGKSEAGEYITDSTYRGIRVYSLYGKNKRPDSDMLKGVDVIVFDIQDVGTRFYTYLTTMGYAMEEASKHKIKFIVLDRPNPVSSYIVEGPVLDKDIKSFTAYFDVPIRHSLTAGEMAVFHKVYSNIDVDLEVVKMEGYKRDMFFDDTKINWINPSPNIRNLNAAVLYSGIGCFEATNISVGRGTDSPFEFFGSPWLDNVKIADELNKIRLKGVEFYPCEKKPSYDLYADQKIMGVCIKVLEKRKVRAFDIFVNAAYLINLYHPYNFLMREKEISMMVGDHNFYSLIKNGEKPEVILKKYKKDIKNFQNFIKRNRILLY